VEFGWSDEERAFRQRIADIVEERLPAWRDDPTQLTFSSAQRDEVTAFTHKLSEHGLLTAHWPREYGGAALPAWMHVILGEELWAAGEPRGPQYMSVNWIGPAIMAYGTEEQKRLHLGKISAGDAFWCQGFSEPDAGSDLGALRCRAIRDGDQYIVNGQKIWTSHTQLADWCFLLVRTDPERTANDAITALLVPMQSTGIEVRRIPNLVGPYSLAEVFFTDVRVPVANRLGDENGGWHIVRSALAFERVGSPRWQRASVLLDALARWAKEHGRYEDAGVRGRLGEARSAVEASRLVAYAVIDERAKQRPPSAAAYVARVLMVRAEKAVAEVGVWLMGEDGISMDSLAGRNYFSTMAAGIAAGSTEVQLNLVAKLVLNLPGS
jgi:alkylation response protein AidB-like acyl-CoA dehydrogenase